MAHAFTAAQIVDIRRFCGYPAFGSSATGSAGWRFFQWSGQFEYRIANLSPEEGAVVVAKFLADLASLETAIFAAGENLDTDQAAVWHHNKNEVADRRSLYDYKRRELCGFLGVPPGPNLDCGGHARVVV